MSELSKDMTYNAIIAVIYVVLTIVSYPISFLGIQFRVAEMMVLLCFFNRRYTIGITFGCIIANLLSPIGFFDCLFGGIATLLSCLIVSFFKHLFFACFIPVILNCFIVGAELYLILGQAFWINVLFIAVGELVVIFLGYLVIMLLRKRKNFNTLINSKRNLDFKF